MLTKDNSVKVEFAIGKGTLVLERDVLKSLDGRCLVMELSTESGPCSDEMCQLKTKTMVKITDHCPCKSYRILEQGNFSIAMTDTIYGSIDRGRECIIIKISRSGNLSAKGFSLTG